MASNFCSKCGAALNASDGGVCSSCGAVVCAAPLSAADDFLTQRTPSSYNGAFPVQSSTVAFMETSEHAGASPAKSFFGRIFGRKKKNDATVADPSFSQGLQGGSAQGYASDAFPTVVGSAACADVYDDKTIVWSNSAVLFLLRTSTGERLRIDPPAIVGKGSAATCRISGNATISRAHARISVEDGLYRIEDMGSSNGTTLNGVRLSRGQSHALGDGDTLMLSNELFKVVVENTAG